MGEEIIGCTKCRKTGQQIDAYIILINLAPDWLKQIEEIRIICETKQFCDYVLCTVSSG
jgi:hypothetical protein